MIRFVRHFARHQAIDAERIQFTEHRRISSAAGNRPDTHDFPFRITENMVRTLGKQGAVQKLCQSFDRHFLREHSLKTDVVRIIFAERRGVFQFHHSGKQCVVPYFRVCVQRQVCPV